MKSDIAGAIHRNMVAKSTVVMERYKKSWIVLDLLGQKKHIADPLPNNPTTIHRIMTEANT